MISIAQIPHGWNNTVGLAADLRLVAALPVAGRVKYLTPLQVIDEIVTAAFQLDSEGMSPIPTKPGLGIELDMDALEGFSRPQ